MGVSKLEGHAMGLLCGSTILCLCKSQVQKRAWTYTSSCDTDGWVMVWATPERCYGPPVWEHNTVPMQVLGQEAGMDIHKLSDTEN